MKALILQQAEYNVWANRRIAAILLQHLDLLDVEVKSSFTSVRKTVHHIWDAELIWYGRMQGKHLPWPPSAHLFKDPTIEDFVATSVELVNLVANADEHFLQQATPYRNLKGETFETLNSGILMHCFNHSTFHRGQIVTILRELGVTTLKSTDLIAYLRENTVG